MGSLSSYIDIAKNRVKDFFAPVPHKKSPESRGESPLLRKRRFSSYRDSYTGRGGGSKWNGGLSASGNTVTFNTRELIKNSRDICYDVPAAHAIVNRYADTVAGEGLRVEPSPKFEQLGISIEQAEEWSENVLQSFDSWAKSKSGNRSEKMNFYQAQRLFQIFQHRENDIFTRLYYSRDQELLNPLQFELLDPLQIRGNAYTSTSGYQYPSSGIELDKRGREKSYNIWVYDSTNFNYKHVQVPRIGAKSKRLMMIHGFMPDFAHQVRGIPRLSHALQDFENLTDFSLAQIKKAIAQSQFTMYVKPSKDNPASNPLEDISRGRYSGSPSDLYGSNPTPPEDAENVTEESTVPVSYMNIPEAMMEIPGSTGVFNLMEGEDLKAFENTAPAERYDSFVNAFTSYLSASAGMPIEVLLMKFSENYSASRGALILFWHVAEIYRQEMVADFCDPIYQMWLTEEIAAGRILAPGWSDPRMKAAWLNTRWIGIPMPNIDPQKTAMADRLYTEMGAQTLGMVARNHNGTSYKMNAQKLQRESGMLSEFPWQKKGGN